MALVCNVAWADFTLSYNQDTNFWGDVITEYPDGVSQVITEASIKNAEVHCLSEYVKVKADGTVSVTFQHVNGQGSHCQHIVGVVLKNADGEIADYHHGKAGGTPDKNTYTLSGVTAGDYALNFYVTRNGSDLVNKYGGTITVTGAVRRVVVGSTAENKIFYNIKNVRSGKYANYEGAGVQFTQVTTPTLGSYWYLMEVADAQGVPEGYKAYRIYNAANALAVENPGSGNMTANEGVQLPAKVYCIGEHTKGGTTGVVIRCLNEDAASWNDAEGSGTKIANHTYDDPGSIWAFEKVNVTEARLIQNAVAVKTGVLNTLATEVTNTQRYHYGYALSDIEAKKAEIEAISVSQTSLVDALTTAITLSKMTPLAGLERVAPKAGDKFTMENNGRNGRLTAFASGNYVRCVQKTSPFAYFDALWTLVATDTEGQFKLYNEKMNVYVGVLSNSNNTKFDYVSTVEEAGVYELSNVDGYATFKKVGGDNNSHLHLSNWGNNDTYPYAIVRWDNGDCSQWRLVKAFGPELTTDANNPICYALKSGRDGNYYFTLDNNKVKLFNNRTVATEETTHWYFMLDNSGNLKMYSKSDNKAMGYLKGTDGNTMLTNDPATTDYDDDTYTLYFAPYNQTNYNGAWFALKPSRGDTYVSNHGGISNYMGFYNEFNDGGTRIAFEPIITYTLTDKVGNRYTGTYSGTVGETTPTFTGLEYTLTNEEWNGNNFTATIEFSNLPFPVSSESVTNATMISSFKDGNGGAVFKWYTDDNAHVKVQKNPAVTVENLKSYSWAIYPSLKDGAFVFSIKNVAANKYIHTEASYANQQGSHNEANTISLTNTPTEFMVSTDGKSRFYYVGSNKLNQYLSYGSVDTDNGYLGVYAKEHNGTTNSFYDAIVDLTSKDDFKNGEVYTFVTARGWMGAKADNGNVISTAKTSHGVTGNYNDPMFQWTVYKSNNGNYYLYNIGKQMFMGVQSANNASVPFSAQPAGKKLTFKNNGQTTFPIMFSTDNAGVVNHSTSYGDGLITWTAGWNKLDDGGSNHKVSYVSQLPEATLQEIAAKVEAYDKRMYVRAEVEGSWENNPNTHFGSVTATAGESVLKTTLKTNPSVATVDYDGLNETTINFTREYRGFEFQGFFLGEENLGKSFTLTDVQKASITAENPLIAKFTATEAVTLFYDDDEFSYRIPAIATTSTGRLIAVSDYRHCLDDIGMNRWGKGYRIDLVIRTSDDNGKTWSNIQTIAEGIDNSQADDCAYGDAAIAVVGEEVVVMAVAGATQYNTGSASKLSRLVRVYSSDNGETWEKTDITKNVYGHEGSLYPNVYTSFFGSGRLAVDPNFNNSGTARIYGSMLTQGNGNIVIYSDDKGLTWNKLGGQVANANEPKIEILPNGQILFSARRNGGRNFNVFTYTDKANNVGTWSTAVNGCDNEGENGTNGETFLVDAKNARGENVKLLLQSQPVGGGEWDRANVSIWYKEISSAADHNHTPSEIATGWTKGMQVSHQLSAYSTMSLQEDGRIAFFFEEAPCYQNEFKYGYCMVYMPLTIEEITKNKYFSPAAVLPKNITVNMVLTDAQGNEYHQTIENTTLANIGESVPSYVTLGENDSYVPNQDGSYTYTNTVTLPFKVSNENGTYWHNMYWPTAGGNAPVYMGADTSGETYVRTFAYSDQQYGNSPLNTQANEGKISWALYSVDNRLSFVFKNKETGKYIKVTGVQNGNAQNVKFAEKADATCFGIEPDQGSYYGDYALKTQNTDFGGYLCATTSTYGYATNFLRSSGVGTDHQGAWVIFKEAPDFDALKTEVNDVLSWIGEGLGKYAVSESNTAIVETAKTAMQTPNTVKLNDLNTYKNLLDGSTLNLPKSGQFMRIKGISGNYIDASSIYDNAQATTGQMSMKSADECNYVGTIFYLDEEKHLLNYATATYIKETREIGSIGDAQKGVWTFAESPRTGKAKYALSCTTTNNNGRNLHDNSGNHADRCSSNCGDRHDFTLEPVTSLPFTFKKAALGYATFHAPVAVKLPEGVIAYVAQIVGESTLKMRKFISENEEPVVVPANTPVMLYKENVNADTQISLDIVEDTYSDEEVAEISPKNSFVGTVAAENLDAEKDCYSLQKSSATEGDSAGKMGFFKKTSGTKGGFKAWLEIAKSASNARAFTIIFDGDDATGLKEALGLENENVEIYDLSGRRLDKPAKGVNVIGGKLVIK